MKTLIVIVFVVVAKYANIRIFGSCLPILNNSQRGLAFYSRGKHHPKIFNIHSERKDRDFDYIDVEVVDEGGSKKEKSDPLQENSLLKPIGNIIDTAKQKLSSLISNVAESVGIKRKTAESDYDTLQSRKSSSELKRLNAEVDSVFANTGLFGGLMKQMVKSVGSTIFEGLAEANRDVDSVKRSVQFILNNDQSFRTAFGSGAFTLLAPTQTSMSSSTMSVNGRSQQRKMLQLVIPVEAAASGKTGMVEVQAAFDSGPSSQERGRGAELSIQSIKVNVLNTDYGQQRIEKVLRIPIIGGTPGGGGGFIDV
mmetsp:Transcript_26929/g.36982  ORF Transcript_26929/g.36982 Transcript_26929/m.36982 type:complete len:310 (-) Transcript_26929:6501-7430(-)|eukprot:CAMPEP_0170074762 /NCGR_PEP_ID=MMETSP0019_2-20121128/12012_1 /TAXON_ID=98059 /ORGANISM="Dinobryon sp., Strain UTEXLB2267" /LENGTH=309 /DNA_ID=CAMNT_0010285281 /DNA_START=300 /DNA_END=1229 /DNA_ORIENTATION=-